MPDMIDGQEEYPDIEWPTYMEVLEEEVDGDDSDPS